MENPTAQNDSQNVGDTIWMMSFVIVVVVTNVLVLVLVCGSQVRSLTRESLELAQPALTTTSHVVRFALVFCFLFSPYLFSFWLIHHTTHVYSSHRHTHTLILSLFLFLFLFLSPSLPPCSTLSSGQQQWTAPAALLPLMQHAAPANRGYAMRASSAPSTRTPTAAPAKQHTRHSPQSLCHSPCSQHNRFMSEFLHPPVSTPPIQHTG